MGARRPPEPTIEPKHFRPDEIEPGITKLRRRIAEVQKLIDDKVHEEDPRVRALEKSIQSTILSVFTATSPEWRDHQYFSVDRVPKRVVSLSQNRCGGYGGFGGGHPGGQQPSQMGDEARRGYEAAIVELNSLVQMIVEQGEDFSAGHPSAALQGTAGRALHPRIAAVSAKFMHQGDYREAILNGAVTLVEFVRERSGLDADGPDLMRKAFINNRKPFLAFNALADESDWSEQEGLGHMCAGAAMALRNPRAHAVEPDTQEDALDCLAFLSYLARRIAKATKI